MSLGILSFITFNVMFIMQERAPKLEGKHWKINWFLFKLYGGILRDVVVSDEESLGTFIGSFGALAIL